MRSELTGHRRSSRRLGLPELTGLGQELGELKTLLRKNSPAFAHCKAELPFETHCKEVLMEMGFSAQAIEQVIEALLTKKKLLVRHSVRGLRECLSAYTQRPCPQHTSV